MVCKAFVLRLGRACVCVCVCVCVCTREREREKKIKKIRVGMYCAGNMR